MANHSPYPHPGPGPSSYYQPSPPAPPPPHHVYGTHSPGPRPNYYPYPPTHLPPHQTPHYQHQAPSRGGHRGGHVNGSYNSRGSHYHHPYQTPYAHAHVNPALNIPQPHPQHQGQHMPYSPQSAKYNQPYSPSYHYPSPTAPVFTPSWQTQQRPLSPLPKQLSMPHPQSAQAFYDPSRNLQPQTSSTPQSPAISSPGQPITEDIPPPYTPIPVDPETPAETEEEAPVLSDDVSTPMADVNTTPSAILDEPSLPQSSSYSQMGTINTTDSPGQSSPINSSPSRKPTNNIVAQWAIWSRRPGDPSHAPSIIISPRARPPPDIVQQALDIKTPPPSRPASPEATRSKSVHGSVEGSSSNAVSEEATIVFTVQSESTVPSSSVTESTNTPTIPGSPVSSHTSVSIRGTSVKDSKEVSPQTEESSGAPVDAASTPAASTSAADTTLPSTEEITPPVSTSTEGIASSAPAPESAEPPSVAPSPAASAAPKKSWASLLRPAASSSPASGASRNALPTSSVVGFSIPALTSNPTVPVSSSQKSELLTLLTTGPAPTPTGFAAAAATSANDSVQKIRPRGLVNSGNMCFANSVLQVLVYCPPFHRLFVELGKLLVGPVVGSSSTGTGKDNASSTAVNGKVSMSNGVTPLVDATAAFVQEFLEDKEKKALRKSEAAGRGGGVNGSSGSGVARSITARGGKGKEKEVKDESVDDEDWDGQSFLPSNVYDAMKSKKRFDTMRGGHQEDAEEFFGFYLDTLEEELLSILHSINPPKQSKTSSSTELVEEKEEAAPPEDDGWLEVGKRNRMVVTRTIKATESPITRIFGGKFRSTLRAPGQKDSVVVEDWRSLRLDIQRDEIHTIQDALSFISYPQPVQVTQPTKPGVTIEAQQQVLIEALPPILVLHVKRFCYDTAVGGVVKVGKHVRYGPELEIGSDVMVPAAKKTQPARYKLFGALYHHGHSAAGGHYTLDVLHPNRYPSSVPNAKPREGWVRIDDELVSDVRADDVFKTPDGDDTRCAYLLFYRRI